MKPIIKPNDVIKIINKLYNIDVSEITRRREVSDLRSIYYYICLKYCYANNEEDIANYANVKRSNVINMSNRIKDRLGEKGYEILTNNLIEVEKIVLEKFLEKKYNTNYTHDEKVFIAVKNIRKKYRNINEKYKRIHKKLTLLKQSIYHI